MRIDIDEQLLEDVSESSFELEETIKSITKEYCSGLDKLVNKINKQIENSTEISDDELDIYTVKLSLALYYSSELEEFIGVRKDIAELAMKKRINQTFITATGAIKHRETVANESATADTVTKIIFSRCYNIVQNTVNNAIELLQSLKKVLSRRITAMQLASMDRGN